MHVFLGKEIFDSREIQSIADDPKNEDDPQKADRRKNEDDHKKCRTAKGGAECEQAAGSSLFLRSSFFISFY